ncbi:hypothetical protein B0H14DRAFT_2836548, partial [Mycena olivaceomarginata]
MYIDENVLLFGSCIRYVSLTRLLAPKIPKSRSILCPTTAMPSPSQSTSSEPQLSLAGVLNLLEFPSSLNVHVPADCLPAAAGNSLAAVAMGIYYTLAAYQENRKFFIATVPMRCL